MKKILLICNHFAPDNAIAAIRTTKLAKYFVKAGFYVKVIAEKKYDPIEDGILKKDAEGIDVVRVENSDKCKKKIQRYKDWIAPHKNKRLLRLDNRIKVNPKTGHKEFYPYETAYPFLGTLDYIVETYRQRDLYKQSIRILDQESDYDVMITSYGDRFCIYAGNHVKKRNKKIVWIFDIRDAVCRYKFTPKYAVWHARLTECFMEKKADRIVAVSKGIGKRVSGKNRYKVHVITNGYDKTDRAGITDTRKEKKKLVFTYTGSMYGGIRDLSPFFRVLQELITEKEIEEDRIEVDYAGNESAYEIFRGQAERYRVAERCEYKGKLSRKEALQLQMDSDVLLVSSYDYVQGEGGVITGKALEYMSAGKPIISIVSGDIVNSELRQIMESCNLGCVYEESAKKQDHIRLKAYVRTIYTQFAERGSIDFVPDKEILKRYDYRYLSRRYINLIKETEKEKL